MEEKVLQEIIQNQQKIINRLTEIIDKLLEAEEAQPCYPDWTGRWGPGSAIPPYSVEPIEVDWTKGPTTVSVTGVSEAMLHFANQSGLPYIGE